MPNTIVELKRGTDVGRVVVEVTVENYMDVQLAAQGQIQPDRIRRVKVDALVDSGATFMCLPGPLIDELGLVFQRAKEAHTVTGPVVLRVFGAAKVHANGRDCITEVMEIPGGRVPLLGQIPLQMMDWWIDLTNHRLVGNPEHGGEWMADLF